MDGFLARLDPKGSRLLYSTLIGGPSWDPAGPMQVAGANDVYLLGMINGPSLPAVNAFQALSNGGQDGYVMRLRPFPTGVRRYGDTSRDCKVGKPTIHALDDAVAGSTTFGLAASQGAPNALSLLLLSARTGNLSLLGINLWIDPSMMLEPLPLVADATGEVQLRLPIPPQTSAKLFAQYVWVDPAGCPLRPFSASDGLEISW